MEDLKKYIFILNNLNSEQVEEVKSISFGVSGGGEIKSYGMVSTK